VTEHAITAVGTVKQPKRREREECVKIGARWVHRSTGDWNSVNSG
jgi:hypothetical protein